MSTHVRSSILMTSEAKQSMNLISKSECPNLQINNSLRQPLLLGSTGGRFIIYTKCFSLPIFLIKYLTFLKIIFSHVLGVLS